MLPALLDYFDFLIACRKIYTVLLANYLLLLTSEFDQEFNLCSMFQSGADDIKTKVLSIISSKLDVEKDTIDSTSNFVNDLGADSLDQVELIMQYEEEFGIEIPDEAADGMKTVGDVVQYIEEHS